MGRPKFGENESKKIQFGIWLGLPPACRKEDERNLESFSKKIGISEKTLGRWKSDPFVQQVSKNAIKMFFGNDSFEVVKTVVEKAKAGSFQHARLFMEYNGDVGGGIKKKDLPDHFKVTFETVDK